MSEQPTMTAAHDVLTLHHGILRRWREADRVAISQRSPAETMLQGAERMMARLPGLASVSGQFGSHAWELATSIASSPQLLGRLGLDGRAMNVAELADLVQVVLEQEEAELEAQVVAATQAARAAKAPSASARPAAARRPAARRADAARKPAPGQANKLAALRKLLQDARSQAAAAPAHLAAGDSAPEAPASVGPASPGERAVATTTTITAEQGADRFVADLPALTRLATAAGRRGPASRTAPQAWVHPFAQATEVAHAAPRALRLAEQAAELAFLQPGAEPVVQPASATADATAAPRQQRADRAPAPASPPTAAAAAVWASNLVQRAPHTAAAPAASTRTPFVAAGRAVAALTRRGAAQTSAAFASATAAPAAASLPALGSSVRFAARALARHESFEQVVRQGAGAATRQASAAGPGSDRAADVAGAAPIAGSTARLSASGRAAPTTRTAGGAPASWTQMAGGDKFAALFARGDADFARAGALVPRLADWLRAADGALHGQPGDKAAASVRPAYVGGDLGAGEWLQPAVEIAGPGAAPTSTETERRAPAVDAAPRRGSMAAPTAASATFSRTAPTQTSGAALPAWLVPAAARSGAPAGPAGQVAAAAGRASVLSAPAAPSQTGAARTSAAPTTAAPTTAARAEHAGAFAAAAEPGFAVPGAVLPGRAGLVAAGLAGRLTERHLAGLEPRQAADAWTFERQAWAPGRDAASFHTANLAAVARAAAGGAEVPAAFRGDLAADAGAGEWLVPGADEASAPAGAAARGAGRAAHVAGPPSATADRAAQARTAPAAGAFAPRLDPATARVFAAIAAVDRKYAQGARQAPGSTLSGMRAGTGPLAAAASAAIDRVVQQGLRAAATKGAAAAGPSSLFDFAGLADQGLLGARPAGVRDAITPWLEQRLARGAAARSTDLGAADTELVALQPDAPEAPAAASPGSTREASRAATPRAGDRTAPRTPAERTRTAPASAEARQRFAQLAAGAVDLREPAALRSALQLFAEQGAAAATPDVARAFLARWFGRPEPKTATAGVRAGQAGEMLALQRDAGGASAAARTNTAAGQAGTPAGTKAPQDQVVLTGLAALAALRKPLAELAAAGRAEAGAGRDLRLPETERELLAPTAEAGGGSIGAEAVAGRAAGRTGSRKATAVQMHEFAPVGLRRGRNLLSTTRRAGTLVRTAPRHPGGSRVGYGTATLGGGELVGLGTGETGSFHGDLGQPPAALTGADRLSSAVFARRSGRTGRGHAAAVAAAGMPQPTYVAPESAPSMPSDFAWNDGPELVNPAAAIQKAVASSGRAAGATAAGRSAQAGAMARVLSVTSTPSANMLPLVAPAASAVVAAAAAKPLSESIVTSGSDPSMGMPMLGQSSGKKKDGQGGEAARAAEGGQQAQDLDALAMKIARSVMVRIKRERERRGIHG